MYLALIDKDLFASLLKYGEIILPDYSFSAITNELPVEKALLLVLSTGNPIEYPSQYIITIYDALTPNILTVSSIKELVATDADGRRLFSTQFREDLIIQTEKYNEVFQEYLNDVFLKAKIKKGIVAFRTLCSLKNREDYDEEVNLIYRGITNRIKYRHHYQLPAEERNEPYALMIAYDRHAPYPRGCTGYFYDVIESFCYHQKPTMGYSESVIEGTSIYKLINSLPSDSTSRSIAATIKDEKFTHICNKFYNKPGGYLTPYLFFILRDRFRESDSFAKQVKLINKMKNLFPEAFDTASIFIGGYFGYNKFYDDYYTILNLPILKSHKPIRITKPDKTPLIKDKKQHVEIMLEQDRLNTVAGQEVGQNITDRNTAMNCVADNKGIFTSEELSPSPTMKDLLNDTKNANHTSPIQNAPLEEIFLDGTDLYKNMYRTIGSCLDKGAERSHILDGLSLHKNNNENLEKIMGLFKSSHEEKDLIKKYLHLSRYPSKSIIVIRDHFKKFGK